MIPIILHNLDVDEYEHPLDAKALNTLENTRGLSSIVSKFYDLGIEKVIKLQFTGSGVLATKKNFPHLIEMLHRACNVLESQVVPELYIHRSEDLQAMTFGVKDPIIALTSDAVNHLTQEEILFLFGREIAHIKSNHILYQEIGFIFPEMIESLSAVTLGLSSILSTGLRYALFYFSQMSQYTADRGGLLACQDTHVAKMMLAKIAGLPIKHWGTFDISDFEEQAKSFEGFHEKTFDKFIRFMYGNNLWAVARAHELINWIEGGDFQWVLNRSGSKKFVDSYND